VALALPFTGRFFVRLQGDHFSGKPGSVREFDSCQGKARERGKCQRKLFSVKIVTGVTPVFII